MSDTGESGRHLGLRRPAPRTVGKSVWSPHLMPCWPQKADTDPHVKTPLDCRLGRQEQKHPKSVTLTPNGSAFCTASPGPS